MPIEQICTTVNDLVIAVKKIIKFESSNSSDIFVNAYVQMTVGKIYRRRVSRSNLKSPNSEY